MLQQFEAIVTVDTFSEEYARDEFGELAESYDPSLGFQFESTDYLGVDDEGNFEFLITYLAEREAVLWQDY